VSTPLPGSGPPSLVPGRGARFGLGEEGARGALLAFVSTLVFIGIVIWAILTSEAWPAVQQQFFSGFHFRESLPAIAAGFWLDIRMFLVAEVAILVLALIVAMIRALRGPAFFPLRATAIVFIDLIRGVPMILLILLLGFGVPALQLPGLTNSPMFWGLFAVVLSYSAYTAEVYRSGIEAVPRASACRPGRWASPRCRRCATCSSPRRSATWSPPCSGGSSACRRTSPSCSSSGSEKA
jgi:His/Glu/Gln/Arg/opine family amino acid ABC transporter permease subunit